MKRRIVHVLIITGTAAAVPLPAQEDPKPCVLDKNSWEDQPALVVSALEWLQRHQTPEEGFWDCDGFQKY